MVLVWETPSSTSVSGYRVWLMRVVQLLIPYSAENQKLLLVYLVTLRHGLGCQKLKTRQGLGLSKDDS